MLPYPRVSIQYQKGIPAERSFLQPLLFSIFNFAIKIYFFASEDSLYIIRRLEWQTLIERQPIYYYTKTEVVRRNI